MANLLAFNRSRRCRPATSTAATFERAPALSGEELPSARERRPPTCAGLHDRLRAHLRPSGRRRVRVEYENAVRARPAVRRRPTATTSSRPARLCDELGLDTISAGGTIAFAMECAERGLLDAAVAAVRRRRRPCSRRWTRSAPARGSGRCSPRDAARPRARSAAAAPTSPRTSRAWRCPATSRGRCRRWRWARRRRPRRRPQPLRRVRGRLLRRARPPHGGRGRRGGRSRPRTAPP